MNAATPFLLHVACLTCSCELEIDDRNLYGTIVACPQCGGMVSVPDPDATPPAVVVASHEAATVDEHIELSPQELRIRRVVVGVFGSLLAILVLLVLYAILVGFPEPVQLETPQSIVDVTVAPDVPNVVPPEPAEPEPIQSVPDETDTEPASTMVDESAPEEIDATPPDDSRDRFLELMQQTTPITPTIPDHSDAIVRRLTTQIVSLDAQNVAAVELARTLADVACISITIEPSLAEESVSVSITEPTSVGDILRQIAATQKASIEVESNQVSWRRIESGGVNETRFDVGDLASVPDLAAMIETLVPLESVKLDGNELVISGTTRWCDEVEKILETLRVVQQLPQRTKRKSENLAAETFGWDTMGQPLSCDVFRPMPLETFLKRLEERTSIRFLIDHAALGQSGAPAYTLKGTVSAEGATIDGVLTAFLKSLDAPVALTYRICGERLIEVTTNDAALKLDAHTIELHKFTSPDVSQRESILTAVNALLVSREPNAETPTATVWPWLGTDWFFVRAPQSDQRAVRNIVATTVTPANTPDAPTEPDNSTSTDEVEPTQSLPF
ncbi:MAG: hypothetical protein ACRC46_04595 [Thermoguttaceae bacterium]